MERVFHRKNRISQHQMYRTSIFLYESEHPHVIIIPNLITDLIDLLNMICKDCGKNIGYIEHRESMDSLGIELCKRHTKLIKKIILENNTPLEAVKLFYALKGAGANPMLEWWDGTKSVDIAISRVKLNIEIDIEKETITHDQAINDLEDAMRSFKNGFTTLRIPAVAVEHYLKDTVTNILGIIDGLKANIKVV